MKILITGAGGLLGSALTESLSEHHHVVAAGRKDLDVCNQQAVADALVKNRAGVVIHSAAWTDTEACETDPDQAYRVNVIGTENVALACQDIGAVLVYTSSTGVFDGSKEGPYTEVDTPRPLTVYHASKLAGETAARALLRRLYVVRLGWLFGGDWTQRRNFVARRLDEADRSDHMVANAGQIGSPTYVRDAAAQIERLLVSGHFGTYHVTNQGSCTRYEYVREILTAAGKTSEVTPVGPERFARRAPVACNESSRNYRLGLLGLDSMRDWKTALHSYIRELKPPPPVDARCMR